AAGAGAATSSALILGLLKTSFSGSSMCLPATVTSKVVPTLPPEGLTCQTRGAGMPEDCRCCPWTGREGEVRATRARRKRGRLGRRRSSGWLLAQHARRCVVMVGHSLKAKPAEREAGGGKCQRWQVGETAGS